MKLSEAMMLGSTTCKMLPADINSCALGCAGNAVGIPLCVAREGGWQRLQAIQDRWPWLSDSLSEVIWTLFDNHVCCGEMTLEQLVDYVRSVEPACGECNQFECSCPRTAAVYEHKEELTNSL